MLTIKNLHVQVAEKEVLRGLNLSIGPGEVHAIMGPNGSGKSTLSKVLAGHPAYTVTQGEVLFEINGRPTNLLALAPEERAREGVFLAYQYPIEIPGITNVDFLRSAFNAICEHQGAAPMDEESFRKFLERKAEVVDMKPSFLDRNVNEGFSGGEKKRNEILQLAVLSPRLSVLDETDSGLDIDSLRVVANGINKLRTTENAFVLITHYQRLLDYVKPNFVHVLKDGRIVESGDGSLALQLEERGYDWLNSEIRDA